MTRMRRINANQRLKTTYENPPHPRHTRSITPCLLTFNLRGTVERDAGAQALDHSSRDDEQRPGQIVEVVPIPTVALFRLRQLRFARGRFADEIYVNVMPLAIFAIKNVIADREQFQVGDLQPGLFADLSPGGLFKALAELDVAARGGVIPFAVRPSAASQQHAPAPHHQNAHPDLWSSICHINQTGAEWRHSQPRGTRVPRG